MIKVLFGLISVLLLIGGICAMVVVPFVGFHYVTGEGEHVGHVTAVEKSGLFFKTYTAYVKTDVQSSQEDTYCVIDKSVVDQLKSAAEKGEKVKVGYYSWMFPGIANCGGEGDIIKSVSSI